jgi:hypothetical protein
MEIKLISGAAVREPAHEPTCTRRSVARAFFALIRRDLLLAFRRRTELLLR